jgi:hypothetical protein
MHCTSAAQVAIITDLLGQSQNNFVPDLLNKLMQFEKLGTRVAQLVE